MNWSFPWATAAIGGARPAPRSGPDFLSAGSVVRNMSDAGMPEARIMAISGHVTRAMFDRYNIGREEDVAAARRAIERFHRRRTA